MKKNLWVFTVVVLVVFAFSSFAQAQDNGVPDTLYLDVWPGDDVLYAPGPWDIRCNLRVTNDIPDSYIDSIAGMLIPLCFTYTNAAANAIVPPAKNNTNLYPFPDLDNSIFRHMPDMTTRTEENWLMVYSEALEGEEWDTRILDLTTQSQIFWLSIVPTGTQDKRFSGGSRMLTATITFSVEDSTVICLDTCFWPPSVRFGFSRSDAVVYVPQIWDDYLGQEYYCFRLHSEGLMVWTQVNEDGFGDSNNASTAPTEVFQHSLYVGTVNFVTGAEVWRSSDGTDWTQVNIDGFGDPTNVGACTKMIFQNVLYAGTWKLAGGAEMWRTSDGENWTQVNLDGFGDPNNIWAYPSAVFNGYMYVGTENSVTGGEVWRSSDGTNWTQVSSDGFGDPNNVYALSVCVFEGKIYAGTQNDSTSGQVWRSSNGTTWTQVNEDGFGDPGNVGVYPIWTSGGRLYAGTTNLLTGTEIWSSCNGTTWTQVNVDGFGDANNACLGGQAIGKPVQIDGATASTWNFHTGAEVWRRSGDSTWTQVNTDGFGDPNNYVAFGEVGFEGHMYVGTGNDNTGGGIWVTPVTWPTITCPGDQIHNENGSYTASQVVAHDPDGTIASAAVSFAGTGVTNVALVNQTGLGTANYTADVSYDVVDHCQAGGTVTVTVWDNDGASAQCTFDIILVNNTPVATCPNDGFVTSGALYLSTPLSTNDADGDPLSWSVVSVTPPPPHMPVIVCNHLEWQTDVSEEGTYEVCLRATDACGAFDECCFSLTVIRGPLVWSEPENIGPSVNTATNEYAARLSPDMLAMFFSVWERPGGYGWLDVWMSTRDSVHLPWSEPVNVGPSINTEYHDYFACPSPDLLSLFFTSIRPDGYGDDDLYVSTRDFIGSTWNEAENLGSTINTPWVECQSTPVDDCFLSMYFCSDRPSGHGGADIWVSTRSSTSDPWGEALNLGPPVNTPLDEWNISISPGELTLYFDSEERTGYGGIDIWMSTRRSTSDPWSEPVNLGPSINTEYNDYMPWICYDGQTLYFGSDRPGGYGWGDIWMSKKVPRGDATVLIPNIEECINPGEYACLPILLRNNITPFGGFELEVEFDYTSMTFVGAEPGELIEGFEKFTYRLLPCPSCGCCKYKILLFGMYDIPNGVENVGDPIPITPLGEYHELVSLCFVVNNDENLRGLKIPVCFEWEGEVVNDTLVEDWECGENTFSSWSGDTLFASNLRCQFNPEICDDPGDRIQPILIFQDGICGQNCGGVDVCPAGPGECKRGDINMNDMTHEVADAVLLASYFVYGTSVFHYDMAYQICATDVNADGRTLTLSDLVYLIRVILHDAAEIPKVTPSTEVANVIVSGGTISTECAAPIGAILFEFDSAVSPTLLADMEMLHKDNKVLVWSSKGKSFSTGEVLSYTGEAELVSVTAVDRDSRELTTAITGKVAPSTFALHPAYPNPFNPFTTLSFNLPENVDYSLKIYNVAGQLVRSYEGMGSVGLNRITWDSKDNTGVEVASGVYFYKLTAGGFSATEKMVILK